jgi:hypothetical protein
VYGSIKQLEDMLDKALQGLRAARLI